MRVATPTPASSDAERIVLLEQALQRAEQRARWAELRVQVLEERLRLQRIQKYGPASEKLNSAQLELLELEPGVSAAEVQAESERPPLLPAPAPRARRPHPGRQELPASLPRVEKEIACTSEQCVCRACGQATVVIGHESSEHLDVKPAEYFVVVTRRQKRACAACGAGGVATAPAPVRIIEKSLVSDRVVIDAMVAKYSDHLPLYRQSEMLRRDAGVEISRATLDGWVMRVGELLLPLARVMQKELLAGSYIQADETPVDVQMHDGRGQNHQAYLWQYSHPAGTVVFDFQLGRGREGPRRFLGDFEGVLQTDGYGGYTRVGGPKLVHAACWAHARRAFFDAVKLQPGDQTAVRLVTLLDDLFAIDREARERGLDLGGRHALRQERARPLLETIKQEVEAARTASLPSSALGKAANYTLTLWPRLCQFLDHRQVELSTNFAENSMRPVALGRKNWIHVGHPKAGPKVAAILSVVESCRRRKIPVRDYLGRLLPGLAETTLPCLPDLTPAAWAAARA